MSFCKVIVWVFLINFSCSSFILEAGTSNNSSLQYVTSSEIRKTREEIHRELDKGPINFKITMEPLTEFELSVGRRILNVLDNETKFKVIDEDEILLLKKGHVREIEDVSVEGLVLVNNESNFILGYIRNTQFYGTIDVLGYVYTIIGIENLKHFSEYKNTSYNAVVYKTKKINDDPKKDSSISNETIISRKDSDSYRSIIGNG